ncbi:16515_t:CDS:1, partial [Dentiscutata heterogama]
MESKTCEICQLTGLQNKWLEHLKERHPDQTELIEFEEWKLKKNQKINECQRQENQKF